MEILRDPLCPSVMYSVSLWLEEINHGGTKGTEMHRGIMRLEYETNFKLYKGTFR